MSSETARRARIPAWIFGCKVLDSPPEDLRLAGVVGDLDDGQASLGQRRARPRRWPGARHPETPKRLRKPGGPACRRRSGGHGGSGRVRSSRWWTPIRNSAHRSCPRNRRWGGRRDGALLAIGGGGRDGRGAGDVGVVGETAFGDGAEGGERRVAVEGGLEAIQLAQAEHDPVRSREVDPVVDGVGGGDGEIPEVEAGPLEGVARIGDDPPRFTVEDD